MREIHRPRVEVFQRSVNVLTHTCLYRSILNMKKPNYINAIGFNSLFMIIPLKAF